MEMEYNGWTNRETWATNLWIDNEFGLYQRVQEIAKDSKTLSELTDNIREMFEELFDFESIVANRELLMMMNDIGSLYRVNWAEIARNIWEESQLREQSN